MVDIVLLKKWVREKKIKFYVKDGKIYCENIEGIPAGESVIVGETMDNVKDVIKNLDYMATNLMGDVAVGNELAIKYYTALDTAIKLLEKQIPTKPMMMQLAEPEYMCSCGHKMYASYDKRMNPEHCSICGQKLDWSDVSERH